MEYRCVATSVEGFVQQLAVAYITHGYWFYVAGEIPEGKEPAAVDAKLVERYGIAISKWARCRRKKQGLANMQYIRHDLFFLLLATKGRHDFFERERFLIRDVRRVPIKFCGYSISCRKGRDGRWHASIRLDAKSYSELKAGMLELAKVRALAALEREFRCLEILPYGPVRTQLHAVFRATNRSRLAANLQPTSSNIIPWKRRIVQPFNTKR